MLPSHRLARILSFSYSLSKRISVAASRCYKIESFNSSGVVENPRTLHYKFVKYLMDEASTKGKNNRAQSMISHRTAKTKLARIVDDIDRLKHVNGYTETCRKVDEIDKEALGILDQLSLEDILRLLNKVVEVVPFKILRLRIYDKSIEIARRIVEQSSPPDYQIVNLLFLVSIEKTAAAKETRFFLKRLRTNFKDLSFMEQCIVSVSTFKAGVKLNKESIQVVEDVLFDKLEVLVKEPGMIVCLIKALRQAGPSPGFSLNKMSNNIRKLEQKLDISTAVPVLGIYAEVLEAEKRIVRKLIDDSIENLNRDKFDAVRVKDVDRLLWATTRLNCKLSRQQIDRVEEFVEHKILQYLKNPKMFVNTILCLWILRSSKRWQKVEYCFQDEIFQPLFKALKDDRQRLDLLMECVRIEAPEIKIPQEYDGGEGKRFKSTQHIDIICELIKCLHEPLGLQEIGIDCPIKTLRIYGITARHRTLGLIHIDLLNKVTCLKNTRKPNGLLSLKLRLLASLGYHSFLLETDGPLEGMESLISNIEERVASTLEKEECKADRSS